MKDFVIMMNLLGLMMAISGGLALTHAIDGPGVAAPVVKPIVAVSGSRG